MKLVGFSLLVACLVVQAACSEQQPYAVCSQEVGYLEAPALAEFDSLSAGPITVHYRKDLSVTQSQLQGLEDHRNFLADFLGPLYVLPTGTQVDYFLYRDASDKAGAFACKGTSPVVITGYNDRYEIHNFVLSAHELTHLYTIHEADRAWSQIFTEGLAVYLGDWYAYQHPETPPSELTGSMPAEPYLASLDASSQFTLREVHAWAPNREVGPVPRVIRYLTAGSFVRYLFEQTDDALVRAYLREQIVGWADLRNPSLLAALETKYGKDLETLEAEWRTWVDEQ